MQIVIVGGVAAGMSCAARLRRCNEYATIIVLEKGPDVSIASCGLPYHVGGEIPEEADLRVQTPEKLRASLNLDVRVNHEVLSIDTPSRTLLVSTPDGEERVAYDVLVLAPGASAAALSIPGIDSPRVHELRDVNDAVRLKAAARQATRAAVVGAGFIGVEVAENLAQAGLEVLLLEGSDHILPPLDVEMASCARAQLRRLGVTVQENARLTQIIHGNEGETDRLVLEDGSTHEADLIVVAVGARARSELAASAGLHLENGAFVVDRRGRTNVELIWAAGDAVTQTHAVTAANRPVQLAGPANRAGRIVADDICAYFSGSESDEEEWCAPEAPLASTRVCPLPLGTAIVRVGELQVAMTGASKRDLVRAGIEHFTVHVHPHQHVTYFPGAQMMSLVLHISHDGRILGAQGVGKDGVDRRIDVIATAMRAGLGAVDLIDLDLCYAPPFGAAKDAVMMAGTTAQNVLEGRLKLWYPWELQRVMAECLVLDVRGEAEAAASLRVPGALLIPHTQLRDRLDEVRQAAGGRPVAVHCKSGVRSYMAHRVLSAAGIESASLSGGMLTLEAYMGDRVHENLRAGSQGE